MNEQDEESGNFAQEINKIVEINERFRVALLKR